MASAREKTRTLRHEADQYQLTLPELLEAAGVAAEDIVEGERWRVRVSGENVVLVRHRAPVVNPAQSSGANRVQGADSQTNASDPASIR